VGEQHPRLLARLTIRAPFVPLSISTLLFGLDSSAARSWSISDAEWSVSHRTAFRCTRRSSIIAFVVGTVLLLGSWLALVFAGLITVSFVIRTRLEARMLTSGLEGDRACAARLPNRLVPVRDEHVAP
jgi:hypothetical protein